MRGVGVCVCVCVGGGGSMMLAMSLGGERESVSLRVCLFQTGAHFLVVRAVTVATTTPLCAGTELGQLLGHSAWVAARHWVTLPGSLPGTGSLPNTGSLPLIGSLPDTGFTTAFLQPRP